MTLISSRPDHDIVDYMRMLERRLARLERGTQGSSGGDDPTVITSLAITGLSLSTQTIIAADDYYRVMMRYSWNAIPDDPSEYNKDPLDGYLTSWSLNGTNYTAELFTTNTFVDVGPFTQGQSVTFRVRGRTKKGTLGNYATITNSTTTDATAPFQPSTPVVTPYLGQLEIAWNGLDVSANQPPTDFRFVEVHLSTTGPTFTPTVATLIGTILRGGGSWIATDLTYGTTYYSRLVAVDTVGNRSPSSTAGSAIPEQLVNADMGPNSIATANIQNLAVNNAKIADLAVGKLTAGTLTANITVSARIMTASTGARAEMNVNGFQAFNSGGGQTFDVAGATGSVTITGTLRTGFPGGGTPYITMQDSGDQTSILFNNAAGTSYAFINSPADGGGKATVQLATDIFTYDTHASRHRLNLRNGLGIDLYTTKTSDLSQIGYGMFIDHNLVDINRRSNTGALLGYRLILGEDQASLTRQSAAGGDTGGKLILTDTEFFLYRVGAGVQNGGQVFSDTTRLYLSAIASGTTNARLILNDDGEWALMGFLQDNMSIGATNTNLLIVGNSLAGLGAAQTWTINYGPTMVTRPGIVYSLQQGTASNATTPAHKLTNCTTTGFTVWSTINQNTNILYWAYRTN